jgi:hypothetical protein
MTPHSSKFKSNIAETACQQEKAFRNISWLNLEAPCSDSAGLVEVWVQGIFLDRSEAIFSWRPHQAKSKIEVTKLRV